MQTTYLVDCQSTSLLLCMGVLSCKRNRAPLCTAKSGSACASCCIRR